MIKVAVVGSMGVPASYGGFETLVENIIGENCSENIRYTIFCSGVDMAQKLKSYRGAELIYLPLRANGVQSIAYDVTSLKMLLFMDFDVVLILGVSGCSFLPFFKFFSKKRVIVNIDGMEWKREKWGGLAKKMLKFLEHMAVRYADVVVADNQAIVDYVQSAYGRKAELIAYGADHVVQSLTPTREAEILAQYGVQSGDYAISVCRIEPENRCDITLDAISQTGKKLLFIGNWESSQYGIDLKRKYGSSPNIKLIDSVYDLPVLYSLRRNSALYIHGHSAGGTNPSLVEAMYCGCNIAAYDVIYNRETTESKGCYFSDSNSLQELLANPSLFQNAESMSEIARRRYRWSVIANSYENLYSR